MAKILGGVPVAGFMSPTDDQDTYPVTKEEYGQGGYRSVETVEEMNAITEERRKNGMLVFVTSTKELYRLLDGVFTLVPRGANFKGILDTVEELDATTNNKSGDFYLVGEEDTGFVLYIYDTSKIESGLWVKLGGGTNDNDTYTNTTPTPVDIGGIASGTTFENKSYKEVLDMLLYPYQEPTISTLSVGKNKYELGESTGTYLEVTWNTTNKTNIKPNSGTLIFNNVAIGEDLTGSGDNVSFPITSIAKTAASTVPLTLDIYNTKNDKITKTINLEWVNAIYYGVSNENTINSVENLTKLLSNTIARTYNFPAGGYKFLVYPSAIPDSLEWKDDATNLAVPFEKLNNISITNGFGQQIECKVFRTLNSLGGSIKIIVK